MHRFLLHNGAVRETTEACLLPGQVGFLNGWGVFSTLRVADGVLFAWERHWARMRRDAARMSVPLPEDPVEILDGVRRLLEANGAADATLRLAIVRNRGGLFEAPGLTRDADVVAFSTGLRSWGAGMRLAVKPDARYGAKEFRGAKITAWSENLVWLEQAQQRGFDEVVLLDDQGRVSECTSANLFAVFGAEVLTPPLDSGCLPGITREILLDSIRVEGLTIREQHLRPQDLERADAVFATSSTRDLLPVAEIEGLAIQQDGAAVRRLSAAFSAYRSDYVEARKSAAPLR